MAKAWLKVAKKNFSLGAKELRRMFKARENYYRYHNAKSVYDAIMKLSDKAFVTFMGEAAW